MMMAQLESARPLRTVPTVDPGDATLDWVAAASRWHGSTLRTLRRHAWPFMHEQPFFFGCYRHYPYFISS